jgi:hypothetical protein
MKTIFKVTSKRGHHEAVLEDPAIAGPIFDKMTGKTEAPLPPEFKTKVPDTWQELQALWKPGKLGYTAIQAGADGEVVGLKEFSPEAQDVVFIAPVIGG